MHHIQIPVFIRGKDKTVRIRSRLEIRVAAINFQNVVYAGIICVWMIECIPLCARIMDCEFMLDIRLHVKAANVEFIVFIIVRIIVNPDSSQTFKPFRIYVKKTGYLLTSLHLVPAPHAAEYASCNPARSNKAIIPERQFEGVFLWIQAYAHQLRLRIVNVGASR